MSNSAPFAAYHPEILLAAVGALIIFIERAFLRHRGAGLRYALGALATVTACAAAAWLDGSPVAVIILALTGVAALLGLEREPMHHAGEFHFLLLVATVGLLLIAKADSLLLAFLGLETTSLSVAVLIAFDKARPHSSEAGLKYFFLASVAAACLLYGFSLLYGLTGTIEIARIAGRLTLAPMSPLLVAALALVVVGFAFKVAAAPFHLWAPDTYQGAPTPIASFVASGAKVAGLWFFLRLFGIGLAGPSVAGTAGPAWGLMVLVVAVVSMLLGNVLALAQTSIKRLLAYSAVAHAGYLLVGFAAAGQSAALTGPLLYYIVTYAVAVAGAFGVVTVVERATGGESFAHFQGLARRAPGLSACLAIFILSLTGLPPLAGFFGKFYLFAGVLVLGGWLWITAVCLAIALSALSFYYYLRLLKVVFVSAADSSSPISFAALTTPIILWTLAAITLLAGLFPDPLLTWLRS